MCFDNFRILIDLMGWMGRPDMEIRLGRAASAGFQLQGREGEGEEGGRIGRCESSGRS